MNINPLNRVVKQKRMAKKLTEFITNQYPDSSGVFEAIAPKDDESDIIEVFLVEENRLVTVTGEINRRSTTMSIQISDIPLSRIRSIVENTHEFEFSTEEADLFDWYFSRAPFKVSLNFDNGTSIVLSVSEEDSLERKTDLRAFAQNLRKKL